jgi:hypothetical protein
MRIDIKDIKKGQVFWEKRKKFTAISDPVSNDSPMGEQWRIKGQSPSGQVVDFLTTAGSEHYGPKLSTENEYPFIEGMD